MNNVTAIQALQEYTKVGNETEIDGASPHRIIQMLMQGALERLSKAKLAMENQNIAEKGELLGSAISIIGGLRDSLDQEAGGPIADNLEVLYEYMTNRLLEANINNDVNMITEVSGLLVEIKTAWDGISQATQKVAANNAPQINQAQGL